MRLQDREFSGILFNHAYNFYMLQYNMYTICLSNPPHISVEYHGSNINFNDTGLPPHPIQQPHLSPPQPQIQGQVHGFDHHVQAV